MSRACNPDYILCYGTTNTALMNSDFDRPIKYDVIVTLLFNSKSTQNTELCFVSKTKTINIVEPRYTGVYHFILIFAPKHRLWAIGRTTSLILPPIYVFLREK